MNFCFVLLSAFLFSLSHSLKSILLYPNNSYFGEIFGESINFYNIKVLNLISIKLETLITSLNITSKTRPMIIASYEPFSIDNNSSIYFWNELGLPLEINSTFFNKSKNKEIYIAVFCDNCKYKLNIVGYNNNLKKFLYEKEKDKIRNLNEIKNITYNSTNVRMDFYSGDGLSALILSLIMIFISLIGCNIMMTIYVHNTQLVEQPLKLGRIEL